MSTTQFEVRTGRPSGYTSVGDWVLLAPISDRAVRVYGLLRMHCDGLNDDEAWPSQRTLASMLGVKKAETIQNAIKELVGIGAVDVQTVAAQHGRHNRYVVHLSPPPDYDRGPRDRTSYYAARQGGTPKSGVTRSGGGYPEIRGDRSPPSGGPEGLQVETQQVQPRTSKPSATARADAGGVDPTVEAGGSTATARRTSRTAPAEVGTQGPAESIMEGEGATVTDLFGGQPPAGKTRKRAAKADDPAEQERAKNAGNVVAAWIEGYRTTGVNPPGPRCGQVGKEAKALLEAGNDIEVVIAAAREAGRQGWWVIERQMTAAARVAGWRQAQPNRIRDFKSPALADQHVYDGQL